VGALFTGNTVFSSQYFSLDTVTLPVAERIVRVSTSSGLYSAIDNALPGDRIVLADGSYDGLNLVGLKGTSTAPIVFVAENTRQAVVSGSAHGRNARLSDCANLEFHGIRFSGASVWGFTMGPAYSSDTGTMGCHNIRVVNCEVDHAGQALLKVNGNSSNIEILGNSLHHSGMSGGNNAYAEGIYVGDGNLKSDRSHDVLIQGNHLYNIGNAGAWGEAMDLKVQVYNIAILDNLIENVIVNSQGAITVLINGENYPSGQTDPNITISRNVIHNVRHRSGGWNGCGVYASKNGITVTNNLVWDTDESSLTATKNATNTTGDLLVYNNTFLDGMLINQSGLGGANQPLNDILKNNLVMGGGTGSNDMAADPSDFVGPITGTASADGYTGSGLRPVDTSAAVAAGDAIAIVTYDVSGALRPADAYTMGAYEVVPADDTSLVYYTLTFSAGNGGSVEGFVYQEVPEGGTSDSVSAVPSSGYRFDGWSGDYTGTENPLTLTNVTQDYAITANFVQESTSTENDASTLLAINCGGDAYVSTDGISYMADVFYTGGKTVSRSNAISGTSDDTLYQSERYNQVGYDIPLSNGAYTVTLHFAETYWTSDGRRVFDVLAEGQTVIDDLDIHRMVGANAAYTVDVPVHVEDGVLNLAFVAGSDKPVISAITIAAANTTDSSTDTTDSNTDTTTDTSESESAGVDVLAINCGGDAYVSADGTSYLADSYYTGGKTVSRSNAISGTSDDTLYQSERYHQVGYDIPLSNGAYTVTLHFAETYWTSDGRRVFDVLAEGQTVIDDLDIHRMVGANAAYTVDVPVSVEDGVLNLAFVAGSDKPVVSAITIVTR